VETLFWRGRAHRAQGEWEQARDLYERVLELQPDNLFVRREMVLLAGILGDDEADTERRFYGAARRRAGAALTEYCTDLLADDPDNRDALIYRSYGLLSMDDTAGALDDMRQAAELYPEDAQVLSELGRMVTISGDHHEAVAVLERAFEFDPDSVLTLHILHGAYVSLEDYGAALAALERMKRINPMYREAYDLAARVYVHNLHDLPKALQQLDILIGLNPTDTEAWLRKVDLIRREGQPSDALAVLDEAIEAGIPSERLHEDRGTVYFTMGRYEDAIEEYTRVIELGPEKSGSFIWAPYRLRCLSHKRLGHYEEAWRDLRRAEELGMNSMGVEDIAEDLREHMPEPEREGAG
jgi:tetratricopeptide (TPR) repeat protein